MNPTTAAEWAAACLLAGHVPQVVNVNWMCENCADAYARQRVEAFRDLQEWVMAMPHCDTEWRGDDHEPCHQQLAVWMAGLRKIAAALRALEP